MQDERMGTFEKYLGPAVSSTWCLNERGMRDETRKVKAQASNMYNQVACELENTEGRYVCVWRMSLTGFLDLISLIFRTFGFRCPAGS